MKYDKLDATRYSGIDMKVLSMEVEGYKSKGRGRPKNK